MAEIQGKLDDKKYVPWIWAASLIVPMLVGVLLNPSMETVLPTFDSSLVDMARKLPYVNAVINSLVSICLVLGLAFILQRKRKAHQAMMLSAFSLSAVFLVVYVTYHVVVGHVPYCEGNLVPASVYYTVLITHIVLSVTIIPLASFSIYRALNETYDRHKKLARITFPLWLYVSVTGVLVVIVNSPCY
jgi:putative membrane protein